MLRPRCTLRHSHPSWRRGSPDHDLKRMGCVACVAAWHIIARELRGSWALEPIFLLLIEVPLISALVDKSETQSTPPPLSCPACCRCLVSA
ncbi:hypothetical protein BDV10DRAFT_22188 [Aspergillus recurvatus]